MRFSGSKSGDKGSEGALSEANLSRQKTPAEGAVGYEISRKGFSIRGLGWSDPSEASEGLWWSSMASGCRWR